MLTDKEIKEVYLFVTGKLSTSEYIRPEQRQAVNKYIQELESEHSFLLSKPMSVSQERKENPKHNKS